MQPTQSKSKTRIFVVAIIVIAVIAILGGAAYAFMNLGSEKTQTTSSQNESATTSKDDKKVTQQTLVQGMSDLNETVDQTKSAHDQATKAVNDPSKRVKVSE